MQKRSSWHGFNSSRNCDFIQQTKQTVFQLNNHNFTDNYFPIRTFIHYNVLYLAFTLDIKLVSYDEEGVQAIPHYNLIFIGVDFINVNLKT